MRFNPVRFIGHVLFGSFGSGLGMILTFLGAWIASGNAGPLSVSSVTSTLVVGLVILLPLIVPVTFALLLVTFMIRALVPAIMPGGFAMTLLLGALGIGLSLLIAFAVGIDDRGETGRYMLLAASVGGALCGAIIAWRMR